jgi:F0F1-type ATP synthase assembly protein I
MEPDPTEEKRPAIRNPSAAYSLAYNMVAGMLVCPLAGYWLDQKLGTGERWTLGGLFLGLAYVGYQVWKVVRKPPDDPESPR